MVRNVIFLEQTLITSQVKPFLSYIIVILGNLLVQQQIWDNNTNIKLQTVPSMLGQSHESLLGRQSQPTHLPDAIQEIKEMESQCFM